ncbi:hypothetical protein K8R47_03790, partial [archaeon]|nr:hypothetical protein [archaeon]
YSDSSTIVSQETTLNDEWKCEVTPNDGTDDGGALNSSSLIIISEENDAPVITLISPENNTGYNDGNITFNYNVTDDSNIINCSLIFNDLINQTSISITKDIIQNFNLNNLESGSYNWSINCTDSVNNMGESEIRIFSVSDTIEFSGDTTNISQEDDISSITNMVIDNPVYGKINFSESVDLSGGADINAYVNISFNRIEINSSVLPALNKSADLFLCNLSYVNPRILKDGSICPSSICTKKSYSGGNLTFNVTHFSIYSLEETPSQNSGSSGGSSISNFIISEDLIKFLIKQGETKKKIIKITNTGNTILDISINYQNLGRFEVIKENSFSLKPGEFKTIYVSLSVREDEISDIYSGKITIEGNGVSKIINILTEVKERKPLFDIITKITEREIHLNDDIKANITIVNMGDLEHIDILLYYAIKNFDGEGVLSFREESLAIDKEIDIVRALKLPKDVSEGKYIFYSKVSYGDIIATSSDVFEVVSENQIKHKNYLDKNLINKIIIYSLRFSPFYCIISNIIFIVDNSQ